MGDFIKFANYIFGGATKLFGWIKKKTRISRDEKIENATHNHDVGTVNKFLSDIKRKYRDRIKSS